MGLSNYHTCDGDKNLRRYDKLLNPQKFPATKVSWYAVVLTTCPLNISIIVSVLLLK